RTCTAMLAPLSTTRTPSSPAATALTSARTSGGMGGEPSIPNWPITSRPSTGNTLRMNADRRPVTIVTLPARSTRPARTSTVPATGCASLGRTTMGESVPSKSSRRAARASRASTCSRLTARLTIDARRGVVAPDEAVDHQPVLDRGDGTDHLRVIRGDEPDEGQHQERRVQFLGSVGLDERAQLLVEGLGHDLVLDLLSE